MRVCGVSVAVREYKYDSARQCECCVPLYRILLGPRARLSHSYAVVYVGCRVRPGVHVLRHSSPSSNYT